MTAGIIAAGHPQTARAAQATLEAGGNAFDAVVAAHFAACVAEPVLASLGGGGFLLARTAAGQRTLYDFFVHTPQRHQTDLDFFPITADFGTVTQEFHIGMGSIAVPGTVRGLFRIQRELGRLPMTELVAPAIALARGGVRLNTLQAYIFDVVCPIYDSAPEIRALFAARRDPGRRARRGETVRNPALADTLEALAREGEGLFYRGEIGQRLARDSRERGGHLMLEDLHGYRAVRRRPLEVAYRGSTLYTNPAPSAGGLLIAFALRLLEAAGPLPGPYGSAAHLERLVRVMASTNEARAEVEGGGGGRGRTRRLLGARFVDRYRDRVVGRTACERGTTHISVLDAEGNEASMTVSNGEGSGYVVPGTGIVMNNMLGEADLNPHGFHRWRPGERVASMMAPTLLARPDGVDVVLGSGGSNRIRTAILQVVSNLVDFRMSVRQAVSAPRLHQEGDSLAIEAGFGAAAVDALRGDHPGLHRWAGLNLYFGGVHAVTRDRRRGHLTGAGDPRRGGVCVRAG